MNFVSIAPERRDIFLVEGEGNLLFALARYAFA
jgi:hypothetical protein